MAAIKTKRPPRPRHWTLAQCLDRFRQDSPDDNGCILWAGDFDAGGYGRLNWGGKSRKAHRLVWTEARGPIPEGLNVCHKCDVRACVNIEHLFLGTQADNVTDMIVKGRRPTLRGEMHPSVRLTPEQVLAIRADNRPHAEIAQTYFIHRKSVSLLKLRRRWRHL